MTINYIALCGAPGAGKSEAQRLLSEHYGFLPVDDSRLLREAAMILYGFEDWHVDTQEGKSTYVTIGNERVTVRTLLGELGKHLEKRDPNHIPKMALQNAIEKKPGQKLSFGSVRQGQAQVFKNTGQGLIVEITREGYAPVNDFDHYDTSLVDVTVHNTYDPLDPKSSTQRLLDELNKKVKPYL